MSVHQFNKHVRKSRSPRPKTTKGPGYGLPVFLAGMMVWAFVVLKPGLANQPALPFAKASPTNANAYYRYCSDARAAGAAPLRQGEPGYRSELDRDGDGVACEPYFGR